jgi:hypothetical protein
MAGGAVGKKPGRITGEVQVSFPQIEDDDFGAALKARCSQERSSKAIVIDIELDNGTQLPGCTVGTCWGAGPAPISSVWFSLDIGSN